MAASFAGPDRSWCLGDVYERSFTRQLSFIIAKHPKYTWGGADLERGVDCSGYLFLAAKWAAIPGVTRTTAAHMALGLGGWRSKEVPLRDAAACDLIFWTFTPQRPCGHVGAFLETPDKALLVTHASTTRGVVLERLHGALVSATSLVRRLTIGD
ncbi:MAG: NlpC/P60 family protein [Desulfomonilaceae bacterium]